MMFEINIKKGLDKYKEGKMSYYFIKDEQIKTFFWIIYNIR